MVKANKASYLGHTLSLAVKKVKEDDYGPLDKQPDRSKSQHFTDLHSLYSGSVPAEPELINSQLKMSVLRARTQNNEDNHISQDNDLNDRSI